MTVETSETETIAEAKSIKEDVTKLTDGDIKWRAKYKLAKEELESAKLKTESEKQAILDKVTETEKAKSMLEISLIDTAVTHAATSAGIKDTEFLKLLDKGEIKVVNGKVEGIDKAISDLKTRKPEWFTTEKKTSTSTGAPINRESATATTHIDAWSLTKEQFTAEKSKLTKGRYR